MSGIIPTISKTTPRKLVPSIPIDLARTIPSAISIAATMVNLKNQPPFIPLSQSFIDTANAAFRFGLIGGVVPFPVPENVDVSNVVPTPSPPPVRQDYEREKKRQSKHFHDYMRASAMKMFLARDRNERGNICGIKMDPRSYFISSGMSKGEFIRWFISTHFLLHPEHAEKKGKIIAEMFGDIKSLHPIFDN